MENVELEINTSEYHDRLFETRGFIFIFSSFFPLSLFVFQLSFWHIYVLSWIKQFYYHTDYPLWALVCCRKELAFSREKGNTEAKKNGMAMGLCVSYFPPVYVSNLYWGMFYPNWFLQAKCLVCRMTLSAYLCAVKQFPPYLHNSIQDKVMTSYGTTTTKDQQKTFLTFLLWYIIYRFLQAVIAVQSVSVHTKGKVQMVI